jgi:hypothetical protein
MHRAGSAQAGGAPLGLGENALDQWQIVAELLSGAKRRFSASRAKILTPL